MYALDAPRTREMMGNDLPLVFARFKITVTPLLDSRNSHLIWDLSTPACPPQQHASAHNCRVLMFTHH